MYVRTQKTIPTINVPSWSEGTDEEILDMVAAADKGDIDLTGYWSVGDERVVHLSAMNTDSAGPGHIEQDVVMVLVAADNGKSDVSNPCYNYYYANTIGKRNYPSFIVQQKGGLANGKYSEIDFMNDTATNSGSWGSTLRRTWCNNVYRSALPSTLVDIFKQVKVKTIATYNGSILQESDDYFFLPAEREIFDARLYSNIVEFNALSQWEYYKTKSNRIKKIGNTSTADSWWGRSPYYNDSGNFCWVNVYGDSVQSVANAGKMVAPCGCI